MNMSQSIEQDFAKAQVKQRVLKSVTSLLLQKEISRSTSSFSIRKCYSATYLTSGEVQEFFETGMTDNLADIAEKSEIFFPIPIERGLALAHLNASDREAPTLEIYTNQI